MNSDLNNLISEERKNSEESRKLFGTLNAEQLNWKPNAESWSVGQCLEHLILNNDRMLNSVENHINGTHKSTFFERLVVAPGFFGNLILKALAPENEKKVKARPNF